jgi:hypothetical protein
MTSNYLAIHNQRIGIAYLATKEHKIAESIKQYLAPNCQRLLVK